MKALKLAVVMLLSTILVSAQDNIYGTFMSAEKIKKITANPSTGVVSGSFTTVEDIVPSAALGANANGYVYYLEYGDNASGEGDGKVDIWAAKADGTGSPVKIANNFDVNGSGSDSDLGFVRLGITQQGVAYILAKKLYDETLYLAKFTTNGTSSVSPTRIGKVVTNDNSNALFENGDLAFDGKGGLYALANNGNGSTRIYIMKADELANATSSSSTTTLTYKWTLKKSSGANFTGRVNGCAFASLGSMYLSTDDGLYFVDQYSTNFSGSGTVLCAKIKDQTDLTDLATPYWPASTDLPVRIIDIRVKMTYEEYQVIK